MNNMKRRFLLYGLIGMVFGIIDWYYLNWLAHFQWGGLGESILVIPIIIAMNYGIWLVPIIPIVFYESRQAQKKVSAALAGMITWMSAIFSYYVYYGILLSLGKLVHLERFNVFGEKYPGFWYYYWLMFKGLILGQFFEWILIAIIGGAAIGALAFWLSHIKRRKLPRAAAVQNPE